MGCTEYIAIATGVLIIAGVIVKKTKNKTDDKVFKTVSEIFNKFLGKK